MTFLTVEALCLDAEFEARIKTDHNVTIANRVDEPWAVVFEGAKSDLIAMFNAHWTNGDEADALAEDSTWLSETIPAAYAVAATVK